MPKSKPEVLDGAQEDARMSEYMDAQFGEIEGLLEAIFANKARECAFCKWEESCRTNESLYFGFDHVFWETAERDVKRSYFEEVQRLAYLEWEAECRRVGAIVHGNDWYHWHVAERRWIQLVGGRYSTEAAIADAQSPFDESDCSAPRIEAEFQSSPSSMEIAGNPSRDGGSLMKPGKNARFPVVPVKARDASHCEEFSQISFDSEEFAGKWIVTDIEETTILAIAASHEELQQILSSPDFPEDVTIHTGPIEQIGKDGECFTPS